MTTPETALVRRNNDQPREKRVSVRISSAAYDALAQLGSTLHRKPSQLHRQALAEFLARHGGRHIDV